MRQKVFVTHCFGSYVFDFANMASIIFDGIGGDELINAFFCEFVGFCDLWLQYGSFFFGSDHFRVFGVDVDFIDEGI